MKLQKKTKRLGLTIIAYSQMLIDKAPNDSLGNILKTRLKNIISPGNVEIQVTPKAEIADYTIDDIMTEVKNMVQTFKNDSKKTVPSLGTSKEQFESNLKLMIQDFDNIVDTIEWYEKEQKRPA